MNIGKYGVLLLSCMVAVSAYAQPVAESRQAPSSAQAYSEQPEAPEVADSDEGASNGEKKEKMVCKREALTGSRFTKKVCMSESDWTELRRATKTALRDMESRPQNPYKGPAEGD